MSIWEALGSFTFFTFIIIVILCSPLHVAWIVWCTLKKFRITRTTFFAPVVIGIVFITGVISFFFLNNDFSTKSNDLADFGSYFGGLLTPIGLFIGIYALIKEERNRRLDSKIEDIKKISEDIIDLSNLHTKNVYSLYRSYNKRKFGHFKKLMPGVHFATPKEINNTQDHFITQAFKLSNQMKEISYPLKEEDTELYQDIHDCLRRIDTPISINIEISTKIARKIIKIRELENSNNIPHSEENIWQGKMSLAISLAANMAIKESDTQSIFTIKTMKNEQLEICLNALNEKKTISKESLHRKFLTPYKDIELINIREYIE